LTRLFGIERNNVLCWAACRLAGCACLDRRAHPADELRQSLDETSMSNGCANRFLFICVRRSRVLPFGGALDMTPQRNGPGALKLGRRNLVDIDSLDQFIDQMLVEPEAR
jgi:hypothetical protein